MYEIKRLRTSLGIRGLRGSALRSSLAALGNLDIDVVRLLFTILLLLDGPWRPWHYKGASAPITRWKC